MPIAVTFVITDLHRGGSPLMLAALAGGLKALGGGGGFLPEVVSIARLGEVAEVLKEAGVPVVSLEAAGNKDGRVVGRFVKHVHERGKRAGAEPHVVMSILIHANILAAAARCMVEGGTRNGSGRRIWVQSIHTVQEKPRWHWWVQGLIGSSADALVVPSGAILKKLGRYGALPRESRVIPNGIEVEKFARAEPMPSEALPWAGVNDAWVVGYVGRFDPVKRIDVLLEAVALLVRRDEARFARVQVALVGYGSIEESLRARAAALGIAGRVHFPVSDGLGLGGTREPERWMKSFHLFCSPSPAEGFGLTLLEARAAGLPVVACGTAAVQEALARDTGVRWVEAECGAMAMARAIEQAMADSAPREVPAPLREAWGVRRMVEQYAAWLQALTALRGTQ